MLASTRTEKIIQFLDENGNVIVKELSDYFKVSEETIRRDLEKIEKMRIGVKRVHGGAYKVRDFDEEAPFTFRQSIIMDEKRKMAGYCIPLIENGDSIMLDSSSTSLCIAQSIAETGLQATIITNSLAIAKEMEAYKKVQLICIGGILRSSSKSFVGYMATRNLENLHAGKAFISCSSIHMEYGLTDYNEGEAQVRYLMMKQSDKRYLVADDTKFGKSKVNHISDFSMVDEVITNKEMPPEWISFFQAKEIPLHYC